MPLPSQWSIVVSRFVTHISPFDQQIFSNSHYLVILIFFSWVQLRISLNAFNSIWRSYIHNGFSFCLVNSVTHSQNAFSREMFHSRLSPVILIPIWRSYIHSRCFCNRFPRNPCVLNRFSRNPCVLVIGFHVTLEFIAYSSTFRYNIASPGTSGIHKIQWCSPQNTTSYEDFLNFSVLQLLAQKF